MITDNTIITNDYESFMDAISKQNSEWNRLLNEANKDGGLKPDRLVELMVLMQISATLKSLCYIIGEIEKVYIQSQRK